MSLGDGINAQNATPDEFIYPRISVAEALSRRICDRLVLSFLWHRRTYGSRGGDERKKEGKGTERRQGDTRNYRPRELNSGYPHDYEAKVTRPLLCPNITVFISIRPTESSVNESERRALSDPPSIEREHFDILSNESLLNFPAIQSLLLSLTVFLSFKKGETPQTRFSLRCILAPSFLSFYLTILRNIYFIRSIEDGIWSKNFVCVMENSTYRYPIFSGLRFAFFASNAFVLSREKTIFVSVLVNLSVKIIEFIFQKVNDNTGLKSPWVMWRSLTESPTHDFGR